MIYLIYYLIFVLLQTTYVLYVDHITNKTRKKTVGECLSLFVLMTMIPLIGQVIVYMMCMKHFEDDHDMISRCVRSVWNKELF
jgi:hypothetical protein